MQQGGSHYGAPPQPSHPFPNSISGQHAEAVRPISTRAPGNFDELASSAAASFLDDKALLPEEGGERGGTANRWPRHETLMLIKIRSDMDATFRDATAKGPLWEEVSRKLLEHGIMRSAKKCKEKFENIRKYYKRTKEGRVGRQDGKNYRFFSQLEAFHNNTPAAAPPQPVVPQNIPPSTVSMNNRVDLPAPPMMTSTSVQAIVMVDPPCLPENTNSPSQSDSDSEWEDIEEGAMPPEGEGQGKRKRGGGSQKTMAFFKELMRRVMEQQEAMQQRFLETIEKREQERMQREEAWKRQEMACLSRELEMVARERATAAARDTAIIAFLQKISGHTTHPQPQPTPVSTAIIPVSPPLPPLQPPSPSPETAPVQEQRNEVVGIITCEPASSRWPKAEVHALIKLRSELDSRYQDVGPKGPLWEEISSEMNKLGYNRSAKRCKEKWENINKYFKKVKERNKKRPEDSKTCPYFHQLDALYRKKSLNAGTGGNDSVTLNKQEPQPNLDLTQLEAEKRSNGGGMQVSNGGARPSLLEGTSGSGTVLLKKPEDILKELMMEHNHQLPYDEPEEEDDVEDEDQEEQKHAYKVEYQRPNSGISVPHGSGGNPASTGSFLAMVQ